MCTTIALLLFFLTFTIFSSLGLGASAAVTVDESSSDGSSEPAEDFLKRLLKKLFFLPDFSTNKTCKKSESVNLSIHCCDHQ